MSKLYLRRIMSNSNRGDTTQLTGEEKKKTFISLQGGKTFGCGEDNEVVLLLADSTARSTEYISRLHAKIFHSIDGEIETYVIQDNSANGTYINDYRLDRSEIKEIRSGDTIKFGHRNGSQIKPGERASHTDAEFAFSVEEPPDEETARLLEQKKTVKIKVFSNSPITKEVVTRVQQEEADSTNGTAEDMMNISSSKRGSALNSECNHQYPSTSQLSEVPPRDPKSWKFSDPSYRTTALFIHSSCSNRLFQASFAHLLYRLHALFPSVELETLNTLVGMCILEQASTKEEYEETISKVCDVLKDRAPLATRIMYNYRDRLIDSLMVEEDAFKQLWKNLCDQGSNQSLNMDNSAKSDWIPSISSAFDRPVSSLTQTKPCLPTFYPHMFIEDPIKTVLNLPQTVGSFNYISAIAKNIYASPYTRGSYLEPLSVLSLQKVSEREKELPVANEVSVIASGHSSFAMLSNGDVASSTSGNADEERHSSSYTSATNSRRRTESEDSEILDVVGGVSEFVLESPVVTHVPVIPFVEKPFAKPVPVAPVAEKLEIIPPVDLSLNSGGTQTPSPVLQENEEIDKKKEVETKNKIEAAAKVLQKTNTPWSDEQAGPTPTARSPVQSPSQILTPADSVASSLNADTNSEENSFDREEEETLEKIGEKPKDFVIKEEKAEVPTEEEPELQKLEEKKVDQPAVGKEKKEMVKKAVTLAPDASKKADRRTKMKQLDDISNDSDSDEEQRVTKRKVVRRSTRTTRASSPKKVLKEEAEEEEMEGAEDDDDEPEIPKNSAKTKRLCSTKGLKRTARGPGRGRRAKSPVAEDEEEDAPPKKRRGRKKKQDEEEEEQQPEEEAEEEKEPEIKKKSGRKAKADSEKDKDPKNLCGVGSRFCFCADMEKETNLHWVMCNTCNQWFHVFCIRMSYHRFTDELFTCCTDETDEQTANAINGFHWASHVENGTVFDKVKAEEIWAADNPPKKNGGRKKEVTVVKKAKGKN